MRRALFSLGTLVAACTSGQVGDEPLPPPAEFPLAEDQAEARLPAEYGLVKEEPSPAPREVPRAVDPVRASRGVRHIPGRGVTLVDDGGGDTLGPADPADAAVDMILPGSRGTGILKPIAPARTPRVVFGNDDRKAVASSLDWPARAIVKIYITWPNGAGGGCTGTLIGRKSVITAGHCIYNPDKGGWAASTLIVPGMDGKYMPFGSAYEVAIDTVTGWTEDQNNDYDYSLITLDRNLGDATGWFGLASLSDGTLDGLGASIQGYPGDLAGGGKQYVDSGPIEAHDGTMLYYDIDTMPGDSGASLRGSGAYSEYVFGVHGGDGIYWLQHYNRAARINAARFTKIQGWIASNAGLGTGGGDFGGWNGVGGSTFNAPTAVSDRNGKVEMFVRGMDGAVWQRSAGGWTSLGGSITGEVAVAARAPGQLDLFVRGSDGALWTKARNAAGVWWPAGSGWSRLGGSITGSPAVLSYGQSRLDVFARDSGGGVAWYAWSGAAWAAPQSLGGAITDHPSVTSWGPGRIDLFARATNGNLVHKWWTGASWNAGWENLGGYIDSAPTAVSPAASLLEVLARGGDAAVWHRRYQGGWSDWASLGGVVTDEIAAVVRTPGQLDLFVRGADGGVYTKAHDGSTWWPAADGWAWLGGDMLSTPAVASTAWNRIDLFARGSDNNLRTRSWSGAAW